jgi:hypothetical protein
MSTAGVRRAQSSLLRMSSSFLSTSPGVRSSSSAMLRCFSGGSCNQPKPAHLIGLLQLLAWYATQGATP